MSGLHAITEGAPVESKSELVYRDLRERIVDGQFTAGYRLVLARLADHYDVSPVPVREALRRLEAEGLVRYTRNVGAEVVGVDSSSYAETMEVLAVLEGAATALAAPHLGEAEIAQARAINAEMREVRQDLDPVRFTTLNHQFHVVVCGPCPNDHLSEMLQREWERISQVRRSSFTYVPERSLTSVEEHERILQLIVDGAPFHEVEQAAREHKLRTMNQFLEARRSNRAPQQQQAG
ncbi:GntR family transcriptional regulator [Luteococcus peritonei]|uniref:GntR family transcriptional regulator n=1 Tax=Luteococcus peritonei TaxID=88874 RepID=A0ABW4RUJ2_9ACTN